MLKPVHRLIASGIILAVTAVLFLLAKFLPFLWFSFYPAASAAMLRGISTVTGAVPFCVWEILLLLLVLWGIISLIISICKVHIIRWLTGVLEIAAILLLLFVAIWGLNHFGPSAADKLALNVREYTQDELYDATKYYASMADQYAVQVERDENGDVLLPEFRELADTAAAEFPKMPQPLFMNAAKTVKPLLSSHLFSYMGITGIFVDITAEPCVNKETYPVSMPFTMCHELSHSCAVAAEDDANFCAYLVCEHSSDPLLRYSGYYSAYIYCYNALYRENPTKASAVMNAACDELRHDCGCEAAYYEQFEGTVQDVAEKANDTYLKTFGEEQGVQSYGAVADMLIAHWSAITGG